MSPSPPGSRASAWTLVAVLCAAQGAASLIGSFRADDWINLERAATASTAAGANAIWTALNPFGLYRPLVDLWHALWLRTFGLEAPPMMALLILNLLAQSLLLARLVRARGGSRETAALAAAALWAQPNTYTWTTLWISNATGGLMVTAALVTALLHARAAERLSRGEGAGWTLAGMSGAFLLGALCKEDIVLLPAFLTILEIARGPRLTHAQQRSSVTVTGAVIALAAAYAAFRLIILPTPQAGADRYHLRLGPHIAANILFFAAHLGALPVVALLLARWRLPRAFGRDREDDPEVRAAMRESAAGFLWAATATLLYLPISGRPSYGYLLAPAVGIAYGVAYGLAAIAARAGDERGAPARILWTHAMLALGITSAALFMIQWHRFGPLERGLVRELAPRVAALPRGAHLTFVDVGERETPAGRTIFNLITTSEPSSFVRIAFSRPDLTASTLEAPGARPDSIEAASTGAVYVVREGRIVAPPR